MYIRVVECVSVFICVSQVCLRSSVKKKSAFKTIKNGGIYTYPSFFFGYALAPCLKVCVTSSAGTTGEKALAAQAPCAVRHRHIAGLQWPHL